MAQVQSTRADMYARRGMTEDEPTEHIQSAGELLIKELVKRQTNTHTTLVEQLNQKKEFERGQGFVSLSELTPGASCLQQFQKNVGALEGEQERSNEVKAVGQSIERPTVRRQEYEQALSVKPNSVETRLYQFAMRNGIARDTSKPDSYHPDHPINHLVKLEQNLMQTGDPLATAKTIRRKRRQLAEAEAECPGAHYKPPERGASLWDAIEPPVVVQKPPAVVNKLYTCKKQSQLYTVKDSKIVKIDNKALSRVKLAKTSSKIKPSGQAFVSLQPSNETPVISQRLTEEEIRQLPRFQNYERGEESKTLYIKNLSNNVTESDLATIFDRFHEPNKDKIIFRLMNGKMRGQAFVTFSCHETATKALELVNGTSLKGKPLVIQYGKQKN